MSIRKRKKAKHKNLYPHWKLHSTLLKWFLRSLLAIAKRTRLPKSGFVLPTVAMVTLVVVLLTTALVHRAFDRSKNASNFRVNQVVLNAAKPALDRARAKIDALFNDPMLTRTTPSDTALYKALNSNRYTLGDETRLKVVKEFNSQAGIQSNTAELENDETLTTAWKFSVDTDNNGKFDTHTLYGIYFRNPTRDPIGKFNRSRNSLEARTPPMNEGLPGGRCAVVLATSDSIVGDSDWYKSGNKLKKSFFVYTANVPITDLTSIPTEHRSEYEQYQGNQGFSALELQQDRTRIPLNNNAAWYEDDIEISNATTVRLNGRVFTNSNLMVAGDADFNSKVIFYQVSTPHSCYYDQENSKITVGGNVANGNIELTSDDGNVEVHRFQGKGVFPAGENTTDGISGTNKTTTQTGGRWVGYNNTAYSQRLGLLVQAALGLHEANPTVSSVESVTRYPQTVKEQFKQRFNNPNETKEPRQILTEELETYFKEHIRSVPYIEVPGTTGAETALGSYTVSNVLGSTIPIRPPDTWMAIADPNGSPTGYTNLPLNFAPGNTMNLRATEPTQQQKDGKENAIGDRILVGNNLPFLWPKYTSGAFDKFASAQEKQLIKNGTNPIYWHSSSGSATDVERTRQSQIQFLPDLASVERNGFWETEAAKQPKVNDNTGGLRVITGAGIYIDGVATNSGGTGIRGTDSFLPAPVLNTGITDPDKFNGNDNIIVWPDLLPMWDGSKKGDLQMRATAVYHYKQGSIASEGQVDANQVPIACVSSYYDPTNSTTARNLNSLPDVSATYDTNKDGTRDSLADGSAIAGVNNGRSNNGVTYNSPYTDDTGRTSTATTYRDKLNRQARMIFPGGRFVNEPLRKALTNLDANTRSLADNTTIDTAICALKILDGTLSIQASPSIPHGAIKEAAFLDARQVKSLNIGTDNTKIAETKADLTDRYTLPLEQRQPLEIRVTELDLNLLRTTAIGTATDSSTNSSNNQEYLLPNSGIIYAYRDDALPDESDSSTDATTRKLVSATDFKLDSTRRPNGIRLINGSNLARKDFHRIAEKGLILVTIPTYIKGDFNLHKDPNSSTVREEFIDTLETTWSDFYTRNNTLNDNFACRQNQSGCNGSGDQWRPATIISDAQTLLSNNFWDGFRNQGDYDLNNHQGNSAVDTRLKNGFWNNNFVTSADWVNSSGYPVSKNSYLTNGVTLIQRRVSFPEYLMEVCTQPLVTLCGPNDWYVNPATNQKASDAIGQTFNISNHKAGTTALAAALEYQRYPRRLAVLRRTDSSNGLILTDSASGGNSPIPIGINSSGRISLYPYTGSYSKGGNTYTAYSSSNKPQTRNGKPTLWYRTSSDANNPTTRPDTSTDRYSADFPLQYMATNIILPETVCVNNTSNAASLVSCPTSWDAAIANLNLPLSDKASGYAVCVASNKGSTKRYQTTQASFIGTCPGNNTNTSEVSGVIQGTKDILAALTSPTPTGSLTSGGGTLTATADVNVYTLPSGGFNNGAIITLSSGGNPNAVFVLKKDSSDFSFGANSCGSTPSTNCNGIKVVLNGVEANNVFWILDGNVKFADVNTAAQVNANSALWGHQIKGNVFAGAMHMGNNVEIEGRLLGANAVDFSTPSTSNVTAIASTNQPLFIPVLQIHSPTGTPGNTPFDGRIEDNWLQIASDTTANAALISGDTPSRPIPSETNGGFQNFVRFLENWTDRTARITGSFIQFKKSNFGSSAFYPVDPTITDASSGLFYTLDATNQTPYKLLNPSTGFRYRGGVYDQRASYYKAPTRAYGFDVAILSQLPDLFAQRFTLNPTSRPNEYFREIGRDDEWIQTLLCAADASDRQGESGATFTTSAISNRSLSCPSLPYPANP